MKLPVDIDALLHGLTVGERLEFKPLPAHSATVDEGRSVGRAGTGSVADQVTVQGATQLKAVAADVASASDLMARLGLPHRPSFRAGYLHPAMDAGLLEMTLPARPRSSKQRYRLTASGRAWLAAHGVGGHDGP